MQLEDGSFTENRTTIAKKIQEYFLNIFCTSNLPLIPINIHWGSSEILEEDNARLSGILGDEEIKLVVMNMHPSKAPGPDGLSCCFLPKKLEYCWCGCCEIGPEFLSELQDARET